MYHGIKIHVYQSGTTISLTTNQQSAFVSYSWATQYEPKPCFYCLRRRSLVCFKIKYIGYIV